MGACGEAWAQPGWSPRTWVILSVSPSQGGDPEPDGRGAGEVQLELLETKLDSFHPPFLQH